MYLTNLHILIAEDDIDDADLINFSFGKCSYFNRINIVQNGVELLDFLNNNRGDLPGIILTDLNMPKKTATSRCLKSLPTKIFQKYPYLFIPPRSTHPTR
jgi:CheY-like chemotaxis protein